MTKSEVEEQMNIAIANQQKLSQEKGKALLYLDTAIDALQSIVDWQKKEEEPRRMDGDDAEGMQDVVQLTLAILKKDKPV